MEIQDFKPKQPVDNSATEGVSAVKEDTPDFFLEDEAVPTVKEEPVLTIEDGKTVSPTELIQSLVELKDRLKDAGMRPLQNVVTSYANHGVAMINGLLESLEGSKKKDK
tara:strand:- start:221 stop:547 length:327 start_codon:yes stop_codon:yes gene_type:complete